MGGTTANPALTAPCSTHSMADVKTYSAPSLGRQSLVIRLKALNTIHDLTILEAWIICGRDILVNASPGGVAGHISNAKCQIQSIYYT